MTLLDDILPGSTPKKLTRRELIVNEVWKGLVDAGLHVTPFNLDLIAEKTGTRVNKMLHGEKE